MSKTTYCAKIEDGYVVALTHLVGDLPDGWVPAPQGLMMSLRKIRYDNGEFIQTDESIVPSPSVGMKRAQSYPSIGDQLDALWHAMDDGLLPVIPEFYEPIKAVKLANPKETA